MSSTIKKSFPPLINSDTTILILGTIPGERSLAIKQYYGHPQNRFWKIIAAITNNPILLSYQDKKDLLHKHKIGLWDTLHSATREGSLDSSIKDAKPNDITKLLKKYSQIKTICFNGATAEKIFNKYNSRQNNIRYIALPSSSPANARFKLPDLQKVWKKILN